MKRSELSDAYFAGGCFWCMEKPYDSLDGVSFAESGYCGQGETPPSYEEVKAQKTSFRETVHIVYDAEKISFEELLRVYFYNIDPFDGGGQFIDRGRSYTCAVFYTAEAQKSAVLNAIGRIEKEFGKPVCVSVEAFSHFYPAEACHQQYAAKNAEAYENEYRISGRADRKEKDKVKL